MATVALFKLAEISSDIHAVDAVGSCEDLGGDPTATPVLAMPVTVAALTGRGRKFGDNIGFQGTETVVGALRLTRDFTARIRVKYAIANALDGDKGTLVTRGVRGSAAERLLFGVELERIDAATVRVIARWEEIGGVAATVVGATFVPDADGFFEVSVVRRWIDTTTAELIFAINDIKIGSETVAAADIGEGIGGTITIGCAGDGLGGYERFLPEGSIVDQVAIEDDAMSFEEIRQEFRRIMIHQPNGYRILRSYIPPGETWSRDPTSSVQRWIASEGDALGFALAQGEKLRDDHLPDRAYGEALEAWESITGQAPRGLETIDDRRTAVMGALRKVLGYSVALLKAALEPLFGVLSPSIKIVEFGALREDDFAVDDISPATPSNIWRDLPGAGTEAIVAGVCSIAIPVGTPNAQWSKDPTGGGGSPFRETSITGGISNNPDGAAIVIDVDPTPGTLGANVISGLMMRNPAGEAVFFGATKSGAAYTLQSFSIVGGVRSALIDHAVDVTTGGRILLRSLGAGLYEIGTIAMGVPAIISSSIAGPLAPRWAGFGLFSRDVASAQHDADFDNAQVFEPESPRGFAFLAYRDPALGGTYNLEKAQAQLNKQEPAHTLSVATDADPSFFTLGDGGRLGVDFLMPRIP